MASSTSTERRPLVSCSPWALLIVLLFLAAYFGWRLAAPFLHPIHDADVTPRVVAARGDLASDEQATIELFRAASPSVVHITTLERRYRRDYFSLRAMDVPQGTGSGFIWDSRGYVVTNFHVIQGASRAVITLGSGADFESDLVGADPTFDIAVLKIDLTGLDLPALQIGTSKDLQVGQKVFAIGNPFGLDHTLTTGIISGIDREIQSVAQTPIRGVIQTDAAINPGNSGGPLLDSAGRLIGMNTAIYSSSGVSAGVGFAVPIDTINMVVPSIIRSGRFDPPKLGVRLAPDQVAKSMNAKGLVIESVEAGSPAEKAGLRSAEYGNDAVPRADVITAIDGQAVKRIEDVWAVMSEHRPGDTVRLDITREGKPVQVEVKLTRSQ